MAASTKKDKYIFYARVIKGINLKTILTVLASVFHKRSIFSVRETGFYHRETDEAKHILFDIDLPREKFKMFVFTKDLDFSLDIKSLNKNLNVKMKDEVHFYIRKDTPNKMTFEVRVKPPSSKKKSDAADEFGKSPASEKTSVDINIIEGYKEMPLPEIKLADDKTEINIYEHPTVVESSEILRIKQLKGVHEQFTLKIKGYYLMSFCGVIALIDKEIYIGDKKNGDKVIYESSFHKKLIDTFLKMTPLSTLIQFFPPVVEGNNPLKVKMDAGTLGTIGLYIKDKRIVDYEETLVK